jgi:hypothetical protein
MHMPRDKSAQSFKLTVLARLFWALLGLCHVPGVINSWQGLLAGTLDPTELGGCFWLTGAIGFLALKVCGVRSLQFATDRQSVTTFIVAVVLMHADAVATRLNFRAVPKDLPVAATTLLVAGLHQVQNAVKSAFEESSGAGRNQHSPQPAVAFACCQAFCPHQFIFDSRNRIPRAPPR